MSLASHIDETGCEWLPLLPSPAKGVAYRAEVWGRPNERKRLAWLIVLLMN